ncbi:hypothetical protein V8F20_012005 [Naviculisporaceae sp. PSN 640]
MISAPARNQTPPMGGTSQLPSPIPVGAGPAVLPEQVTVTNSIPIKIPLTKLERLRHMVFKSSTELRAREKEQPTRTEIERLRIFSEFVGIPNQKILFKRQLPQCHRYLVELAVDGSQSQTYICIEGLKKQEDIRLFYAVMSQRKYRKYYEPWKLCFRMVEVSNCGTAATDDPGMEKVSAECHIYLEEGALTLCGSHIKLVTEHGERISTIGGLIQVGPVIYALTTAHTSGWPDGASSTTDITDTNTLRDDDFPDDVESILIVSDSTTPELTTSEAVTPLEPHPSGTEAKAPVTVCENQKDDWCLIPVSQKYQLPNADWTPGKSFGSTVITDIYTDDPGGLPVYSVQGKRQMSVGSVGYAPSFLDGLHGPIEVWAVNLEDSLGQSFGRGDSGTWFVTIAQREVVGSLIARSRGKALIALLSSQLESISRSFPLKSKPTLPRPEVMLLQAAYNSYSNGDSDSDRFVALLFEMVRQPDLSHSPLTRTLQIAHEKCDLAQLGILITLFGSQLESFLKDTQTSEALVPSAVSSTIRELASIYWVVADEFSKTSISTKSQRKNATSSKPTATMPATTPRSLPAPSVRRSRNVHFEDLETGEETYRDYHPPEARTRNDSRGRVSATLHAVYHLSKLACGDHGSLTPRLVASATLLAGFGVVIWLLVTREVEDGIRVFVGLLMFLLGVSFFCSVWRAYLPGLRKSVSKVFFTGG